MSIKDYNILGVLGALFQRHLPTGSLRELRER